MYDILTQEIIHLMCECDVHCKYLRQSTTVHSDHKSILIALLNSFNLFVYLTRKSNLLFDFKYTVFSNTLYVLICTCHTGRWNGLQIHVTPHFSVTSYKHSRRNQELIYMVLDTQILQHTGIYGRPISKILIK